LIVDPRGGPPHLPARPEHCGEARRDVHAASARVKAGVIAAPLASLKNTSSVSSFRKQKRTY
jgi:hypothetical protein